MTLQTNNMIAAIVDVLINGYQSKVTANDFASSVHEAMPQNTLAIHVISKPAIRVKQKSMEPHGASPLLPGSLRLFLITFEIEVIRPFDADHDVVESVRDALNGLAFLDGYTLSQALARDPQTLLTDASSNATGIISGILRYVKSETGDVVYTADEGGTLSTLHQFTCIARDDL